MQAREQEPAPKALHWLAVGYISPGAQEWVKEKGGQVFHLSQEGAPVLVAVGIAYDPAGAWTWSRGERQHREGIEFWSHGVLEEASTGIELQYRSIDARTLAEYSSAETTYLILPDEEFNPQTRQVGERGIYRQPDVSTEEVLSLEDDHPF